MKIAMLGTRGVPASYSGFETCVEELGSRLVQRGHQVTVYCRSHHIDYDQPTYKGMRLIKLPTIANKYLDTIIHSFLSSLHALDSGLRCGLVLHRRQQPGDVDPAPGWPAHAAERGWTRLETGEMAAAGQALIQFAEYMSTVLPDAIITDSRVVQRYYEETYRAPSTYIAYGAELPHRAPGETLARFGLEPQRYALFVGRLVPENCAHHLVEAWRRLDTDMRCVIVGDAPYAEDYKADLRKLAGDDPQIVFTGYIFGEGYWELSSKAYAFVETSGVGGTHPALVEAMAFGNCVVTHDTPENLETIGDAGLWYDGQAGAELLAPVLETLIAAPPLVEAYRQAAAGRAATVYSWEAVTDAYEALFKSTLHRVSDLDERVAK